MDVLLLLVDVILLRLSLLLQLTQLGIENKIKLFQLLVLLLQAEDGLVLRVEMLDLVQEMIFFIYMLTNPNI